MAGITATANTVEEQPVQNGEADFPLLSSSVNSSHHSSFIPRKTKANGRKVSRRFRESKESNVKEAEAILEVFLSGEVQDRHSPVYHHDDGAGDLFQPVDLEFDDILLFHQSELDFYYEKKGKICRKKRERPHSEDFKMFCRAYCTRPSKLEIKRWSRKPKQAPFDLCKKEITRYRHEKENASYRKENVEKTLLKKHIQRKWPDGMPRDVERTPREDGKRVKKTRTEPIHMYNNSDFVLRPDNADKFGEDHLLSFLIQLQDRDITPEDFDALLHLDEFVEPKTVPKAAIDALKTDTVNASTGDICTICMEEYCIGNVRKWLLCGHHFHSGCARTWLSTVSYKCPIDGREIV